MKNGKWSIFGKISISSLALIVVTLLMGACTEETKIDENTQQEASNSVEKLAYVREFKLQTRTLIIDEVEWIEDTDSERIEELGLDISTDLPTGFMIYDESAKAESMGISEEVQFYVVNQEELSKPKLVEEKEFISYLLGVKGPYEVTIEDGIIVKVVEKYTP